MALFSNHCFFQQSPFPIDYPLLFVIPSGARDLQFCGPCLEHGMRDVRLVFPCGFGDDLRRFGTEGRGTRMAHCRSLAPLGMTKRTGSSLGRGDCWKKQWLLNRGIYKSNLDRSRTTLIVFVRTIRIILGCSELQLTPGCSAHTLKSEPLRS